MGRWIGAAFALVLMAAVGGWLTLRRPDISYAELERRYATPASRYVELPDGVRMHYRDSGRRDGPVIMLLHGFSASAADWEGWAGPLGANYRVIAPDLPGHGLTRAPPDATIDDAAFVRDVDALVDALRLPPLIIAGNSMGGGVAWRYALAHPQRVRGLVLVDASGWPEPARPGKGGADVFQLMRSPIARMLLRDLDVTAYARQGLQAAFFDPALVTRKLVTRYTDLARAPGHRDILLGTTGDTRDVASTTRLAAIRTPTLVMFGADDRLIPAENADRFAAAIPEAEKIVYLRVGHLPMEQIPARSVTDFESWLNQHQLDQQPPSNAPAGPLRRSLGAPGGDIGLAPGTGHSARRPRCVTQQPRV